MIHSLNSTSDWLFLVPLVLGIPFLPLIGLGATAIGSLFGNKNQGGQRQTGTSQSTSTIGPTVLGPEYAGLQSAIMPMIHKRLLSPGGLPRGYEESGITRINRTHDLGKQSLANNLTARGLGSSPIAGAADTRSEMGRLSDIVGFQNTLPMLGRQMQNEDLGMGMDALEFGRSLAGRTATTSGNTSGTTTNQGGGGMIGNLSSMLGWMIGNGAFGGLGKAPLPDIWQGPPNPSW